MLLNNESKPQQTNKILYRVIFPEDGGRMKCLKICWKNWWGNWKRNIAYKLCKKKKTRPIKNKTMTMFTGVFDGRLLLLL